MSLEPRCLLLAVEQAQSCSVLAVPPLRKKNSSHVTMTEEVVVVVVAEVTGPPTPVEELAVVRIAELDRRPPANKLAEREAELSATRMISPPFERDLGSCP